MVVLNEDLIDLCQNTNAACPFFDAIAIAVIFDAISVLADSARVAHCVTTGGEHRCVNKEQPGSLKDAHHQQQEDGQRQSQFDHRLCL